MRPVRKLGNWRGEDDSDDDAISRKGVRDQVCGIVGMVMNRMMGERMVRWYLRYV